MRWNDIIGFVAMHRLVLPSSREKLDEILRNGNDGMWSEDDFPRASPTSTQRPQPKESGPRTRSKKGMPKVLKYSLALLF